MKQTIETVSNHTCILVLNTKRTAFALRPSALVTFFMSFLKTSALDEDCTVAFATFTTWVYTGILEPGRCLVRIKDRISKRMSATGTSMANMQETRDGITARTRETRNNKTTRPLATAGCLNVGCKYMLQLRSSELKKSSYVI